MATAIDHSRRVHEFLLSPLAYAERPSGIELRETHISWVYLTDRYVYKQKKPVSFEFLDFSTLERREHFCHQEVILNQRLSPEVYLGTVPVTCDASGKYHLKRGKNVVEWLVKMKRLDDTETLENLLLNERLNETHIERLSNRLTQFYASQAPAMVRSNDFLRRLRKHVLANRNDLLVCLTDAESTIQYVTNAQLRCLSLESDYFVQRVADGRVVDGHGDLRPEHVYFHRAKPLIIDCIEFNAEYRTNDVVDELAFLSMECDRLGNQNVGEALLTAYLKAGHDEPRAFLSAFYKCYRACVRAKVAALRAAQTVEGQKAKALAKTQAYMHLAKRYAEELASKVVIIVGGLSGTGKSTLATALQDPLAAELLQTDVIRNELYSREQTANGKYTPDGRRRVYNAMIDRMQQALARSPTLVLDGTFSSNEIRKAVLHRALQLEAKVLQVQCECPATEARERIAHRIALGHGLSEATPELHSSQVMEYEAITRDASTVTVDTTQEVPMQVEAVINNVRKLGPLEE